MKLTDTFIQRPVWAIVVSLFILILGLRSIFELPVNQWPRTENTVVTIPTSYYGADAPRTLKVSHEAYRYLYPATGVGHRRVAVHSDPGAALDF